MCWDMGVSKNRGTLKWMVYNGKPYSNWWFWGVFPPYFWRATHIPTPSICVQWTWRSGSWDHRHICSINKGVNRQTLGFGLAQGLTTSCMKISSNQHLLVLMQPRNTQGIVGQWSNHRWRGKSKTSHPWSSLQGRNLSTMELLGWLEPRQTFVDMLGHLLETLSQVLLIATRCKESQCRRQDYAQWWARENLVIVTAEIPNIA